MWITDIQQIQFHQVAVIASLQRLLAQYTTTVCMSDKTLQETRKTP